MAAADDDDENVVCAKRSEITVQLWTSCLQDASYH